MTGKPRSDGFLIRMRSIAFSLALVCWTAGLGLLILWALLLPPVATRRLIRIWARGVLLLARVIAGISWTCPDTDALQRLRKNSGQLLAIKHQSAWETIVFLAILPEPCYVLKQELLRIPFYGWFTRKAGMIAIDRAGRGTALKVMVAKAKAAVAQGRSILIFPEGTRIPVGDHGPIHPGILALQKTLDLPIVPLAHNSGVFWGRRTKRPGTITLRILPEIPPGQDRATSSDALRRALFDTTEGLVRAAIDPRS